MVQPDATGYGERLGAAIDIDGVTQRFTEIPSRRHRVVLRRSVLSAATICFRTGSSIPIKGMITDCIGLYNFLRNPPLDLTTYNAGGVSSGLDLI